MRLRTWHFFVSGAIGGAVGFALMEGYMAIARALQWQQSDLVRMGIYFSGFGLAVGAALGMTEGWIRRNRARLWYGLVIGMVLGGIGGFVGGCAGQAVFALVPMRYATATNVDIAIALDSSGSMRMAFFFGSDPRGERKKAAARLVDRLSGAERVSIVDFDERARVLCPLTALSQESARERLRAAIARVDDSGGTNLDAGLLAAIDELSRNRQTERPQHVIFLTDGAGDYTETTGQLARRNGIVVHTIGLGSEVEAPLLREIAETTGGRYYPVDDAGDLTVVFTRIFEDAVDIASQRGGSSDAEAELLTNPLLLRTVRIIGWGIIGIVIGLGQGIRENTREDLRACGLGGLIGGLLGGAAFDPVADAVTLASGLAGRAIADVIVGACIGGAMRVAQRQLVEVSGKPTTTLLRILPEKETPGDVRPPAPDRGGARGTARPVGPTAPPEGPRIEDRPREPIATHSDTRETSSPIAREPITSFEERYDDQGVAMAAAFHLGGHRMRDIAEHFGVSTSAVRRAVDLHAARLRGR